jgi:epoxyqueuosine reductase
MAREIDTPVQKKRPLSKAVVTRANTLGFTPPRIVDLSTVSQAWATHLESFVELGRHGTMAWLEETKERRAHPNSLWPEARSAIVVGMNYGPETDPLLDLDNSAIGNISVYARGRDYHDIIKGRLKELAGLIARDSDTDVKVFVDTAPLMEKPLAALAGLGWQGKHTNLVSRDYGSWLFLGVILSAAEFAPSPPEIDHCGSCRSCLDICPTDAFPAPYEIDARKCISYLTIEFKGKVDLDLRAKMGNRIYGCDDCLAVCPWNKFAQSGREIKLAAREDLNAPPLAELAQLDDAEFRAKFSGSPIKRIGRDQFIRNVLYAIGNSGETALRGSVQPHIASDNPVVADAARWALRQLETL